MYNCFAKCHSSLCVIPTIHWKEIVLYDIVRFVIFFVLVLAVAMKYVCFIRAIYIRLYYTIRVTRRWLGERTHAYMFEKLHWFSMSQKRSQAHT